MFGNFGALAFTSFLMHLASWPPMSRCQELSQNSPNFLNKDVTIENRLGDIDYNSFIGLMGRRNAGDLRDVFVGLGRRNPESDPWKNVRHSQPAGGFFIQNGRLRFQRNT